MLWTDLQFIHRQKIMCLLEGLWCSYPLFMYCNVKKVVIIIIILGVYWKKCVVYIQ